MSVRIATTLVLAIAAATAAAKADAGSLWAGNTHITVLTMRTGKVYDLNSVPDITNKIVREEPGISKASKSHWNNPAAVFHHTPVR